MKITLVTDPTGTVVGTIQGHALSQKKDGVEVGVMVPPGHTIHHVDVDESHATITDAAEFHAKVAKYVPTQP
jgi:hypothetical protein